jgi:thiamine pyrophosphate-dependent acetolactate synthase large subunit-like protein
LERWYFIQNVGTIKMNERIKELMRQACKESIRPESVLEDVPQDVLEKFAELIVEAVLDEVEERTYYAGDRDWSDEVDRPWIQLEFGYGSLADAQKGIFK